MTEQQLMIGIAVLSALATACAVLRLRGAKLPATTFAGFESRNDLWGHFRAAGALIAERKWILYVPLGFLLVDMVAHSVIWSRWPASFQGASGQLLAARARDTASFSSYVWWGFRVVLYSPAQLLSGYVGSFYPSLAGVALVVLALILFRVLVRQLKRYATEENMRTLSILQTALAVALGCAFVLLIAVALPWGHKTVEPILYILHGANLTLAAAWLFVGSLVEACFLLSFVAMLRRQPLRFRHVLNGSLAVLVPLVKLRLIFYILFTVPMIPLMYPFRWLGSALWAWRSFAMPPLQLLLCCAPFFVVMDGEGALRALRATVAFVVRHLRKYLVFTGLCAGLLSIPGLIGLVLRYHFSRWSWEGLIVQLTTRLLAAGLVAATSVALLGFFLQYGSRRPAPASASDPLSAPQGAPG